ncbi:MAG: tRNA-intron lyase [Candidatus Pacearchaeota archaeon]
MKIQATLISEKISSNSREAYDLFESQRFGERDGEKVVYMLVEAFYLFKDKKMEVIDSKNRVFSEKEILKKFEKIDKKFLVNYYVFRDLRKKGYVVKTALKFGAEFRVYERGEKVGEEHSKWICFPVSENKTMTWHDFSSKNRVAHSTKKNLLIAVVDEENDVTYFEIKWMRVG